MASWELPQQLRLPRSVRPAHAIGAYDHAAAAAAAALRDMAGGALRSQVLVAAVVGEDAGDGGPLGDDLWYGTPRAGATSSAPAMAIVTL